MRAFSWFILGFLLAAAGSVPVVSAQEVGRGQRPQPAVTEGDYVIHDFRFDNGETIPELSLHNRTLGTLRTDEGDHALNAFYIMHGTTGNGANFPVPRLANELYGPGQPLDTAQDYLILPGGIGHGSRTKAVLWKQYLAELLRETGR